MAIAYPSAPQSLVPAWDNQLSFQSSPVSQRKTGGTEQRGSRYQINQDVNSWSAQFRIDDVYKYREIDTFLRDVDGKPFQFEGYLYKCLDYRWTRLGNESWEFSAQFEQVYRP